MYSLFDYNVYYYSPSCEKCKYYNKYDTLVNYSAVDAAKVARCNECRNCDHWVVRLQYKDRVLFEVYPYTTEQLTDQIEEQFKKLYADNIL